jgi:hypothetical protein
MIYLVVFAVGGLICCWVWGNLSARALCCLSALYGASWGLLFVPVHGRYLFPVAQCVFAIAFGGLAFGVDWLMRDAWHVR